MLPDDDDVMLAWTMMSCSLGTVVITHNPEIGCKNLYDNFILSKNIRGQLNFLDFGIHPHRNISHEF